MSGHLRILAIVDSRAPFDGERYWRWEVYRMRDGDLTVFALGWTATKREALRLAELVRAELRR